MVLARWRHLINGIVKTPRGSRGRLLAIVGLVVPIAFFGLFLSSFSRISEVASVSVQAAVLATFTTGLGLSNLFSKMASGDSVRSGSAENAFYLSHPIVLHRLMLARCLGAAVLDFWGALFLFPVLAGASTVWRLGGAGLAIAATVSILGQVSILSAAQAVQTALHRWIAPRRRRLMWTILGLSSALMIALLWIFASMVLRRPSAAIALVSPFAERILNSPLGVPVAALRALLQHDTAAAWFWLIAMLVGTVGVLVAMAAVGRFAGKQGWEDDGDAAREINPVIAPRTHGKALSIAGRDWLALARDRPRFVMLLAMPIVLVAVALVGTPVSEWTAADPVRVGVVAYSLCAYLATIGPLTHMQSERQVFWILRSAPVPFWRVLVQKTQAWALLVVGFAVLAFVVLGFHAAGFAFFSPEAFRVLLVVIVGALVVTALAVGIGCDAADLSAPGRSAIGPGTVYLFLIVSGLYNLGLSQTYDVWARATALFVLATVLFWMTGVRRAEDCLDAERLALPRAVPGDGMVAAILLYLGVHATQASVGASGGSAASALMARVGWSGLVAFGVCAHLLWIGRRNWRRALSATRWAWRVGMTVLLVAVSAGLRPEQFAGSSFSPLWLVVIAEELVFRGLLQGSLVNSFASEGRTSPRGRVLAGAIAASVALLTMANPSWEAAGIQIAASIAFGISRSAIPTILGRIGWWLPV
jgi:hypothetical protein